MTFSNQQLWLFCLARALLSMIFTAYSGILTFAALEWQLTATAASSIQSGWHVCYLFSLFVAGFLSDRFGAERVFVCSAVLSSIAALLFALFAVDYASALLLYALAGLVSGGTYTSGLALVYRVGDERTRGRNMGMFLGAASLGYAGGLLLIALAAQFAAWRHGLHLIAGASWCGAVLSVWCLRGLPRSDTRDVHASSLFASLRSVLKDRQAMSINWAYMFHCWELFALWAWTPAFLAYVFQERMGMAASFGVLVAGCAHFVSVLGSVAGGAASDRFGRLRSIAVIGTISALASAGAGWTAYWPIWAMCAYFGLYSLFAIADSPIYSTALAETIPADRLGVAFSVRSVMGFAAGAVSPLIFGLLLDQHRQGGQEAATAWIVAWSSLAVVSALVPVVCFLVVRK
ncbi:MAG TPA: MFS transporter [Noviherbaspirillum sp.]|uniref:MFS transporter n=1 Tax=Noviherbaspirillum sp. TaxID=1926288 RepID=UPI002F93168C